MRKDIRLLALSVLFMLALSVSIVSAQQTAAGAQAGNTTNATDILSVIREDHAQLLSLAYQVENLNSAKNNATAAQVASRMAALAGAHMTAEEQVFYPALAKFDPVLISDSIQEHNLARQKSSELQSIQPDNMTWISTFEVLKDLTKQHMDEEETGVFHVAEVTLGETQLSDLGPRFRQAESAVPGFSDAMTGTTGTPGTMFGATSGAGTQY